MGAPQAASHPEKPPQEAPPLSESALRRRSAARSRSGGGGGDDDVFGRPETQRNSPRSALKSPRGPHIPKLSMPDLSEFRQRAATQPSRCSESHSPAPPNAAQVVKGGSVSLRSGKTSVSPRRTVSFTPTTTAAPSSPREAAVPRSPRQSTGGTRSPREAAAAPKSPRVASKSAGDDASRALARAASRTGPVSRTSLSPYLRLRRRTLSVEKGTDDAQATLPESPPSTAAPSPMAELVSATSTPASHLTPGPGSDASALASAASSLVLSPAPTQPADAPLTLKLSSGRMSDASTCAGESNVGSAATEPRGPTSLAGEGSWTARSHEEATNVPPCPRAAATQELANAAKPDVARAPYIRFEDMGGGRPRRLTIASCSARNTTAPDHTSAVPRGYEPVSYMADGAAPSPSAQPNIRVISARLTSPRPGASPCDLTTARVRQPPNFRTASVVQKRVAVGDGSMSQRSASYSTLVPEGSSAPTTQVGDV